MHLKSCALISLGSSKWSCVEDMSNCKESVGLQLAGGPPGNSHKMAYMDDQLRNVPHQFPSTIAFQRIISQAEEVLGVRLENGALISLSSSQ